MKIDIAVFTFNIFLKGGLKTFGDVSKGVYSQAIDENSTTKQKGPCDRLASNICLKINSKLGGKNFKLSKENM